MGLAVVLSVMSMSAFGAVVNGVFSFNSANILNLYSATLDGACTPSAAGEFFNCNPDSPAGLAVSVVNVGANPGGGTLDVQYENTTGEITQVNSILVFLRDLDITITGFLTGFIEVRNGNGIGWPAGAPGTVADDVGKIQGGTLGGNATVDPDEDFMFNTGPSVTLFQHADAPNIDAPDFSSFSDIVDTCTGTACALIPVLGLDGVKFELAGTVNALGGDALTLTTETANNSSYVISLTTAVVPVPAAAWMFGSALGLLGWMRRRAA
jgi:hypothetical protein